MWSDLHQTHTNRQVCLYCDDVKNGLFYTFVDQRCKMTGSGWGGLYVVDLIEPDEDWVKSVQKCKQIQMCNLIFLTSIGTFCVGL